MECTDNLAANPVNILKTTRQEVGSLLKFNDLIKVLFNYFKVGKSSERIFDIREFSLYAAGIKKMGHEQVQQLMGTSN